MNTHEIEFDGIKLLVPSDFEVEFPVKHYDDFPSYCGAGRGLGDLIVPESILGLRVSVSCYLHDLMWHYSEPTWQAFHHSNSCFLHNILSIIDEKSTSWVLKHLRNYRAVTYYNSVDTIGNYYFWKTKEAQAMENPLKKFEPKEDKNGK